MPTMTERLEENRRKGKARLAPEITAAMLAATENLAASGIQDRTLKTGDRMPAFALPNAAGDTVTSEQLLDRGRLVINFYRGGWCSYCNIEMRALQERHGEIEALDATLVAIAPELPTKAEATRAQNDLTHEVLSDAGNAVSRQFGLVFTLPESIREIYAGMGIDLPDFNGGDTFELPVPATYVVDREGTVLEALADPDYRKRLDVEDILATLKSA